MIPQSQTFAQGLSTSDMNSNDFPPLLFRYASPRLLDVFSDKLPSQTPYPVPDADFSTVVFDAIGLGLSKGVSKQCKLTQNLPVQWDNICTAHVSQNTIACSENSSQDTLKFLMI